MSLLIATGIHEETNETEPLANVGIAVLLLVPIVAWWTFNAIGWSPGQRAVGLQIIRDDGSRPGLGQGFARSIGMLPSLLVVLLGFLWPLWDDRRQTWHDKIAGTYVIRR